MQRVMMDNLGIPPLAGLCSYEDACKLGYDVERNVTLLKRYNFVLSSLNRVFAAHLARTPEWEVKCAFGLHTWLVAEHAASIRRRVAEMREPPLHLDAIPDERLQALIDDVIRATSTIELLTGIYRVVLPDLVDALSKHMEETNRLVDYPTCRVLRLIRQEADEMMTWGESALMALTRSPEDAHVAEVWAEHLGAFLTAAGGIAGDRQPPEGPLDVQPRSDGTAYQMDATPRRDARFVDTYNRSARVDEYYRDENRAFDERMCALLYKRLREMDVPEWMAPILYKTQGKPWDYYVDLSRQLWDEARHAMMGEIGLYQAGVPFYHYPISIISSEVVNSAFTPLEAHVFLWGIEQNLMPRTTGKRYEWEVARASGDALVAAFQDYDWADEVLHTQIGRRWLMQDFGGIEHMNAAYKPLGEKYNREADKLVSCSRQEEWWHALMADVRR